MKHRRSSSSEAFPLSSPSRKRTRSDSSSSLDSTFEDIHDRKTIPIYLVQAKIDPSAISDLNTRIEQHNESDNEHGFILKLCHEAEDAKVIVTAIQMRKRLERHLEWDTARQKAIVTLDWLWGSLEQNRVLPCGDFAAIQELHDATVSNCPDGEGCSSTETCSFEEPIESSEMEGSWDHTNRYACCRASPLHCPNDKLVKQLAVLRLERELEGLQINSLGYERAIAVIKSYPKTITTANLHTEVAKLPYIGTKVLSKIEEFVKHGYVHESREIESSQRFQSLRDFSSIYGIGPSTARHLYSLGLRTLTDLDEHYSLPPDFDLSELKTLDASFKSQVTGGKLPTISIQVGLAIRHDLGQKIPRPEVEEIRACIMRELEAVQTGCYSVITGGYRRGKPESNDVDIVISHPQLQRESNEVKGLGQKLVERLRGKDIITNVMYLSSFRAHNALRTSHWDSLEKALTVFKLPGGKLHRRVDLIFAAPQVFWTAVAGWTGSKVFERDLRLWAKQKKGLKFDSSGITRRHDSKEYYPKSEREIFELMGLPWVPPKLRNADA